MAATVRVVSDVHFEFHRDGTFVELFKSLPKVDYLVLAGDMCTVKTLSSFRVFLNEITPLYRKVIYVLGNHEYYTCEIETPKVVDYYRAQLKDIPNLVLLENQVFEDEHVRIFGTTLWSQVQGPMIIYMADFDFIKLTDYLEMHKKAVEALTALAPKSMDLIVTHHLPSFSLVSPEFAHCGEMGNSGFASHCDALFNRTKTHWVYGHTHTRSQVTKDGVCFTCSPVGYPRENPPWQDTVITIEKQVANTQ
jgi:predicted phosphodiesterase